MLLLTRHSDGLLDFTAGGEQEMRCVVTGAAGFIGSSIVDRLLADGHTVTGIDCFVDYYPREIKERNLAQARRNSAFTFIEADLIEIPFDELLEGVSYVFHQAAQAGVRASWGSYFDTYVRHNVLVSQRLLEAARQASSLKKIVYASSSSVYGNAEQFPTSEAVVPRPVSPYGVTKLAAENLMSLYASEFSVPTVSLRYFTVYGPRQRPEMAFHRFIKAGLSGAEIEVYGDGEQSRDFTYIDDIVSANLLAAEKGVAGEMYNIGGGEVVTINHVLDTIAAEIGPLNISRKERQKGDARHTSAETSKAKRDLGFSPLTSVQQGLQHQIAWLREEAGI